VVAAAESEGGEGPVDPRLKDVVHVQDNLLPVIQLVTPVSLERKMARIEERKKRGNGVSVQ
jgi:hypothetical protein